MKSGNSASHSLYKKEKPLHNIDVYKRQIINRVLNEQYSRKIDGLPGNDDLGTMGAWYVFACIGLYPEIPGIGGFTVNTPIFSSVKVHLKKGDVYKRQVYWYPKVGM